MKDELKKLLFNDSEKKPLKLRNGAGRQVYFGQVFSMHYDGCDYCILSPLSAVEGAGADTAFVFRVEGEKLVAERAENIVKKVFSEYYKTLKKSC